MSPTDSSNGSPEITKQIENLRKSNKALRQQIQKTQKLCGIIPPIDDDEDDNDTEEEAETEEPTEESADGEGEGESEGEAEGEGEGEDEDEPQEEDEIEDKKESEAKESKASGSNAASKSTPKNTPATYRELALSRRSGFPIPKPDKKEPVPILPPPPPPQPQPTPTATPQPANRTQPSTAGQQTRTQPKETPADAAEKKPTPSTVDPQTARQRAMLLNKDGVKILLKSQLEDKIDDILKSKAVCLNTPLITLFLSPSLSSPSHLSSSSPGL